MANETQALTNPVVVFAGSISAACVAVSAVAKHDLLPLQLQWLGEGGVLVVAAAFMIGAAFGRPHRYWPVVATASAFGLLALRLTFVVDYVHPESHERQHLLVGLEESSEASKIEENAKTSPNWPTYRGEQTLEERIQLIGVNNLEGMFGLSLHRMKYAYTLAYLVFLFSFVLTAFRLAPAGSPAQPEGASPTSQAKVP